MGGPYDAVMDAAALFAGVSPRTTSRIRSDHSVREIATGAPLFRQEEPAERLYLLVQGRLDVSRAIEDGQEITLRMLAPGSICGGVAALGRARAYPVSATAVEPSIVLGWSGDLLRGLAREDPRLGLNMADLMYAHAEEIQSRLGDVLADHMDRRVAATLVRLARRVGRRVAGGVLIDLPLTPRELAEIAVTTLHTASNVLGRWERAGLIKAASGTVVLCDPRALSAIAGVTD